MRKLRVFRSVGEVFSGVTRHYFQLLVASWPAVVVLFLSAGVYYWVYFTSGVVELIAAAQESNDPTTVLAVYERLFSGGNGLILTLSIIVGMIASALAAVRWHRFVLLGDGNVSFLRSEDGRYIWTFIKVWALYVLTAVFLVAGIVGGVVLIGPAIRADTSGVMVGLVSLGGIFVVLLFGGYVTRLMLALPDAAIGQAGRVFTVFRMARGNTWRLIGYTFLILLMMVVVVLIAFLLAGVVGALLLLLGQPGLAIATIVGVVLYVAIYLYFVMVGITMLSVAYREIVGLPQADATPAPVEA
jgi:hypothetical protein